MKNSYLTVNRPEASQAVIEFYSSRLTERLAFSSILDYLEILVDRLLEGWKQKDPRTFWEISNHHPRYISCKISELFQSGFHRSDAEQTYRPGIWIP